MKISILGIMFIGFLTTQILYADPPNRVARLSYINGTVSFLPGGENQWTKAQLNRPLTLGDSLWSDMESRVELQLGLGIVRLGPKTYSKILNLNNQLAQFKLTEGTLALSIFRVEPKETYEINTPNIAIFIRDRGYYRIRVDNNITWVTVRKGHVAVYGQQGAYKITAGQSCQFSGTTLKVYRCAAIGPLDAFDRWNMERDTRLFASKVKYVSPAMIGYQDLPAYGTWQVVKRYGQVWFPNNVGSNWAPYRYGQWIWVRRWGWTWLDAKPWGFAPFHYGRWSYIGRRWAWIPGPIHVRPVYAPALVTFVGGRNYQLTLTGGVRAIGWFPLGPGEIYIPPYRVSRQYFNQVNLSNTYINQPTLVNVYNNQNTVIPYQNANVVNGVTVVPTQTFVESQPVEAALATVPPEQIIKAPKTPIPAIAPEPKSLLGGPAEKPPLPPAVEDKEAIVKTPPEPIIPFTEEQKLLDKNPGKPLDLQEMKTLESGQPPQEEIKIGNPQQEPKPIKEIDDEPSESKPGIAPAPENQQPQVIQPETTQPQEEIKPQVIEPQVIEPQVIEPQVIEPQVIEPPGSADPELLEPSQPPVIEPETPAVQDNQEVPQPEVIEPETSAPLDNQEIPLPQTIQPEADPLPQNSQEAPPPQVMHPETPIPQSNQEAPQPQVSPPETPASPSPPQPQVIVPETSVPPDIQAAPPPQAIQPEALPPKNTQEAQPPSITDPKDATSQDKAET